MFNTIIFYVIITIPIFLYFYINKYYKKELYKFLKFSREFFDEVHSNMELIYEDAAETEYTQSFSKHID
jgi:hypothetical protein